VQTKFIRKDFECSSGHPGDGYVDYEWSVQTLRLFRRKASRETLGADFLHTEYDHDSTTHLIVHFAAKPEVNILHLSAAIDQLSTACWHEANKQLGEHYSRHGAIRQWSRATMKYSLLDGRRLSDGNTESVPETGLPEARIRLALASWARDTAWNLDHTGYVRVVTPIKQGGTTAPTAIQVSFHAPHQRDELAHLVESFENALATEMRRLSCVDDAFSSPTPWP
jgi:hypothetical protein